MNPPPNQAKKRVALITSVIDNRKDKGTALVARRLLERLPQYENEYEFTLIHHAPVPDPLYGLFKEIVMPQTRIPFAKHFFQELMFWARHRYTAAPFDIIHYLTPRVWPSYLAAHGKQIIVTAHEGGVMLDLHTPTFADYVFRITNRFLHHRMNRVVAVSRFGKSEIEETFGIPSGRVVSIYNGIDENFYKASATKTAQYLKEKYGIAAPYILSVGRLDPHKNIHRLVDAFIPIAKQNTEVSLVLVGGKHLPEYSEKIEHCIRAAGLENRVYIAPFISQEDLPHVYDHALFLMYPSLHEGFGLPILEAMACGTPVAIANRTSLPEIAGGAALTFDPLDTGAITQAMERLLADTLLRDTLIQKGKERLHAFSWDTMARETVALYRSLTFPTTTYPNA